MGYIGAKYFQNSLTDGDIKSYLLANALYDIILVPVLDKSITNDVTAFKKQDPVMQFGILLAGTMYSFVAFNKNAYNNSKWWKMLILLNLGAYINGTIVQKHRKLDNVGWLLLNDLAKAIAFVACYKSISNRSK